MTDRLREEDPVDLGDALRVIKGLRVQNEELREKVREEEQLNLAYSGALRRLAYRAATLAAAQRSSTNESEALKECERLKAINDRLQSIIVQLTWANLDADLAPP